MINNETERYIFIYQSEFFDLVRKMRLAQKDYFRERTQYNLRRAKALERDVDTAINKELLLRWEQQANNKL